MQYLVILALKDKSSNQRRPHARFSQLCAQSIRPNCIPKHHTEHCEHILAHMQSRARDILQKPIYWRVGARMQLCQFHTDLAYTVCMPWIFLVGYRSSLSSLCVLIFILPLQLNARRKKNKQKKPKLKSYTPKWYSI